MRPFDRPYTTFNWSAIVTIAPFFSYLTFNNIVILKAGLEAGLAWKYQWYISTIYIYHDSIMILSSENMIFLIFSKHQPLFLLFIYFSNSCISNTNGVTLKSCLNPPVQASLQPLRTFCFKRVTNWTEQTAQVPKLLDGAKILRKILTLWVGCNNVTDDRHRRTAHAIKWT